MKVAARKIIMFFVGWIYWVHSCDREYRKDDILPFDFIFKRKGTR